MSNPAVIILAECSTLDGHSFRVEDNIGESIHLHYHNIRIDLTIKEFLAFAEVVEQSINNLLDVDGFQVEDYDPRFLADLGEKLLDLESVKVDTIELEQIEVYVKSILSGKVLRTLPHSHVVRALRGDEKLFRSYRQENRFGENNMNRLEFIAQSIREHGYPHRGEHIVLVNDQNIIRDGQHRASVLYHLNGPMSIPVRRFYFRGNRHNCSRWPFLVRLVHLPIHGCRVLPRLGYRLARRCAGKLLRATKRLRSS